jgi:hypothetical protein
MTRAGDRDAPLQERVTVAWEAVDPPKLTSGLGICLSHHNKLILRALYQRVARMSRGVSWRSSRYHGKSRPGRGGDQDCL